VPPDIRTGYLSNTHQKCCRLKELDIEYRREVFKYSYSRLLLAFFVVLRPKPTYGILSKPRCTCKTSSCQKFLCVQAAGGGWGLEQLLKWDELSPSCREPIAQDCCNVHGNWGAILSVSVFCNQNSPRRNEKRNPLSRYILTGRSISLGISFESENRYSMSIWLISSIIALLLGSMIVIQPLSNSNLRIALKNCENVLAERRKFWILNKF
jgi:hypothetical protein